MDDIRPHLPEQPDRFVDQLRQSIRRRGLSFATEKTYVHWALRFIRQQGVRHPNTMGPAEVTAFLTHLAEHRHCAPATQRTALNALVFLYEKHFEQSLGELNFHYARRSPRMPTAFSHCEAQAVLAELKDADHLIASLLYGSGLRLAEAIALRVKDLDFAALQITVRGGKGGNERFTLLPSSLTETLQRQIRRVASLHQYDLDSGYGEVYLPDALAEKYPSAAKSLAWQFVFPSRDIGMDPRSGVLRRHHRHHSSVQRAVARAIRASGFSRRASCHTFRHSFATRLIETGYDIKLVQSLLGHRDIRTTEVYLHIVKNRAGSIVSPLDRNLSHVATAG